MSAKALSQTLQVGDVTIRNRVAMASLTRNRNVPGSAPNDIVVEHYKQRAQGGTALIFTEGTLITRQGTEWPHAPGIWSQEHVDAWKKVTDAVHSEGAAIFSQLWHVGRVAHPDTAEQKAAGTPVYAPSAISARGGKFRELDGAGYVTPTAVEDPRVVIEQYRAAAENAKKAGFDGVELHSANGYLPNQFLDKYANQRTDEWGGSVENRTRFAIEAIKALIDVWGPGRVGIKLNPAGGYNDVGMPLEDTIETFTYLIKELVKLNIAYVQLARYNAFMDVDLVPPYVEEADKLNASGEPIKRGTPHDVLATFGHLVKGSSSTRLLLNSGLSPEEAENLIREGKIDAAVFGIPSITNPDLYKRIEQGKELNQNLDFLGLYNFKSDPREGYNDYPTAT